MRRFMNEYERIQRMTSEELDAEIEWERRTALPRWLVWLVLTVAVLFGAVNIVQALG